MGAPSRPSLVPVLHRLAPQLEAGRTYENQLAQLLGVELGLLLDDRDLLHHLARVVGADLGAEAVLERRDDAAAVGVVLGVGAGDDVEVERQADGEGRPVVRTGDVDVDTVDGDPVVVRIRR